MAPVFSVNWNGMGQLKYSMAAPPMRSTPPMPQVEASVMIMAPELGLTDLTMRVKGTVDSSNSARIHSMEWAIRLVWTSFLALGGPSFVANTAQTPPRNGRIKGTTLAKNDSAPASDCSCFLPTTGFAIIFVMRSTTSETFSAGMVMETALSSYSMRISAPIHFTEWPDSVFSILMGKPATAAQRMLTVICLFPFGSLESKTMMGSST